MRHHARGRRHDPTEVALVGEALDERRGRDRRRVPPPVGLGLGVGGAAGQLVDVGNVVVEQDEADHPLPGVEVVARRSRGALIEEVGQGLGGPARLLRSHVDRGGEGLGLRPHCRHALRGAGLGDEDGLVGHRGQRAQRAAERAGEGVPLRVGAVGVGRQAHPVHVGVARIVLRVGRVRVRAFTRSGGHGVRRAQRPDRSPGPDHVPVGPHVVEYVPDVLPGRLELRRRVVELQAARVTGRGDLLETGAPRIPGPVHLVTETDAHRQPGLGHLRRPLVQVAVPVAVDDVLQGVGGQVLQLSTLRFWHPGHHGQRAAVPGLVDLRAVRGVTVVPRIEEFDQARRAAHPPVELVERRRVPGQGVAGGSVIGRRRAQQRGLRRRGGRPRRDGVDRHRLGAGRIRGQLPAGDPVAVAGTGQSVESARIRQVGQVGRLRILLPAKIPAVLVLRYLSRRAETRVGPGRFARHPADDALCVRLLDDGQPVPRRRMHDVHGRALGRFRPRNLGRLDVLLRRRARPDLPDHGLHLRFRRRAVVRRRGEVHRRTHCNQRHDGRGAGDAEQTPTARRSTNTDERHTELLGRLRRWR